MKTLIGLFGSMLVAALTVSAVLYGADAASGVQYDRHGRPYVVAYQNGKPVRFYCRKALYGVVHCPSQRSRLRYGPYDRDFAVSQGYHITR